MAKTTQGVRPGRKLPNVSPTAQRQPDGPTSARRPNVSPTARHFGWFGPTVYRWLARFDRQRLDTLDDRSGAPPALSPDLEGRADGAAEALRDRILAGARTSS